MGGGWRRKKVFGGGGGGRGGGVEKAVDSRVFAQKHKPQKSISRMMKQFISWFIILQSNIYMKNHDVCLGIRTSGNWFWDIFRIKKYKFILIWLFFCAFHRLLTCLNYNLSPFPLDKIKLGELELCNSNNISKRDDS